MPDQTNNPNQTNNIPAANPPAQNPIGQIPSQPTANSKKKIVIIILIIALAITAFFLIQKNQILNKPQDLSLATLKDQQSAQRIKNITGFGLQELSNKTTGTADEKLAALLYLHEEETAAFQLSTNSPSDIQTSKALNLTKMEENPSGENLKQLMENLIKIQDIYVKKGKAESKTRIDRLKILENYLGKFAVSDTDKIPQTADKITLDSHPADNQKDLAILLIKRFNIWLQTVQK